MVKARTARPRSLATQKAKHGLVHYRHPDFFGLWLGYQLEKLNRRKGTAKTTLIIRKDHLSPAGRVHGGVVSAFFDFACGAAVFATMDRREVTSTVELKVNYFKPIILGDHLLANTEVVFRGKRIRVVHGKIFRKKELVAMATATFNVTRIDA